MKRLVPLLLASCLLANCETSSSLQNAEAIAPISTATRCAPIPADLVNASKRKHVVTGDSGYSEALRAIQYGHSQNAGLKRALSLYKRCREA